MMRRSTLCLRPVRPAPPLVAPGGGVLFGRTGHEVGGIEFPGGVSEWLSGDDPERSGLDSG